MQVFGLPEQRSDWSNSAAVDMSKQSEDDVTMVIKDPSSRLW